MGRAAGCPTNARWPGCCPTNEPAGRGGGPIGTPGRACGGEAGRGVPGVDAGATDPKPVETGGGEAGAAGLGAKPGARFAGKGWRGPERTCPGRGEPAAGMGRGSGGTGRPGRAGEAEGRRGAAGKGVDAGRDAPTGG